MIKEKSKNILYILGFSEGHITSTIKLVEDLVSLGHNIYCYVSEQYAERFKNTGAKLEVFSINKEPLSEISYPDFIIFRNLESILSQAAKDKKKYDYLLVDSLIDGKAINKIFKASTVISIHTLQHSYFPEDFVKQIEKKMVKLMSSLNKKYNIDLKSPCEIIAHPNADYKLVLTSKEFQSSKVLIDDSFYFIGPSSFEEKPIDKSFPFKKDSSKKLIYISLGTLFNDNIEFFKLCIKAFAFSKEFQLILSVGKACDLKVFGNPPDNVYIYNFVPQNQILKEAEIFISHGGLNSINESLLMFKKPLIVVPQFSDQFDNADQIKLFEAGIVLEKEKVNEETIKNAVNSLIVEEEKYKRGVQKIVESFEKAKNERKSILEKILI